MTTVNIFDFPQNYPLRGKKSNCNANCSEVCLKGHPYQAPRETKEFDKN